jgi:glycosyltransferase involved in cell wall biosynthesis
LFDAYSQGLPVIASETEGIADYMRDGVHGTSFDVQDPLSFASAVSRFQTLRPQWQQIARNCLTTARRSTHENMHRERAEAINSRLQLLLNALGA